MFAAEAVQYTVYQGLPVNEIDADILDEDQPRSAAEVARRCIALYAILAAGHKEPRDDLTRWLRRENLWGVVSPQEAAFLESKAPARQQFVEATWRAEALVPLLWALGKIQHLPPLTTLCDVLLAQSALPPLFTATSEFISNAVLRSDDDISEAREEIYQAHWAVRDAQINNGPVPNGFNGGAIQERHHALNWLVGYWGQDWDDVTTDT